MPQLAPITFNDGTTDHVFNPRGIDGNNVASLVEGTGVPIGDRRLTVQRSRTAAGREKASFRFTLPTVATETINGVSRPSVARTAYADLTFSFDPTSSSAERVFARMMVLELLSDSMSWSVVDHLETLY